jgi:hypothetical protein
MSPDQRKKQRAERNDDVLRRMLEHPDGRAFVFRMLQRCHVYRSFFRGPAIRDTSDQELRFRAAVHSVGIWLRDEAFRVNPVKFQEMEREGYREYMEDRIAAEKAKKPQKKQEEQTGE